MAVETVGQSRSLSFDQLWREKTLRRQLWPDSRRPNSHQAVLAVSYSPYNEVLMGWRGVRLGMPTRLDLAIEATGLIDKQSNIV
ncbi:hypothetical protein N7478_010902 [Penicillium angulare]|uniref:uncharacterized protein n=1 Tax=Penicillium angulare TaxID=116970 RepID=UPI002540E353|nr:uncharacterized protein N7478_010902 [Penicillium angulare]KAJ5263297.1 hypothetical protein N7478_010902 [Penicillium angulare]